MQFQKSADTKILENVLSNVAAGDTITYDEMSRSIGRDVREFARNALGSARRGVLNEKGIVFAAEHNVGLVRLDDVAIVSSIESDRKHMLRTAHKSLKKLSVVSFAGLPEDQKRAHVVASAQIGAIAMFSQKSSAKKISSNVNGSTQLAIGETLKMFT